MIPLLQQEIKGKGRVNERPARLKRPHAQTAATTLPHTYLPAHAWIPAA